MSIRIDIDGLDRLKRELESMEQGLKLETIDFWCKRILNDVKLKFSTETVERLVMEAIPSPNGNFEIKFSSPPEFVSSVEESVRKYLPEMPITTKAIFDKFLEILVENVKEEG